MTSSTVGLKPQAFSLKDFLGSFLLIELFKGMALTGKYAFRKKVTLQYPEEKTPLSPAFGACMPYADMKMARNDALPANCARPYVRQWPLPSNLRCVTTAHAAQHAMTLT